MILILIFQLKAFQKAREGDLGKIYLLVSVVNFIKQTWKF